jgi:hypothetical protein
MDFGNVVSESFDYAKEGLWGKWTRWILMIIASIIFPFMMGYILRVYRGQKPVPEIDNWGTLFIDGLKFLVIAVVYAIPVIIVLLFSFMPLISVMAKEMPPGAFVGGSQMAPVMTAAVSRAIAGFLLGLVVLVVLSIIIALVEFIGIIRFARTGSIGEAFNFGEIFAQIDRIGWLNYIISLIIMVIIVGIISGIVMIIPFINWVLLFIISPFLALFQARYITQVYDSGAPVAPAKQ